MEYFTHDDCRKMLESYTSKTIGSVLGNDDAQPYLKEVLNEDVDRVYDCLNVWCSIYEDICRVDSLVPYIKSIGFIEAIRNASIVSGLYKIKLNTTGIASIDHATLRYGTPWTHLIGVHPVGVLQVLDYPKRLLIEGSNLDKFCKDDFIRRNRLMKEPVQLWKDCLATKISRKSDRYENICYVGKEADPITWRTLYDMKKALTRIWGTCSPDFDYFKLPGGSTYEGKKSYVDKFVQISRNFNWIEGITGWNEQFFLPGEHDVPLKFCNKLITVPKNWKSKRIVCPEETARQVIGYTIAHSMRKRLLKINRKKVDIHVEAGNIEFGNLSLPINENSTTAGVIDLTDQTRNQVLAQYASMHDNLLATVDFSAASDSISTQLVKLVVPEGLLTLLDGVRSQKCKISDKVPEMNLNTFMTMGHACTFDLETGLFWSMAVSAVQYCWIFLSSSERNRFGNKLSTAIAHISVYGDDVIIPDFAYDYFILIASKCGFKVNEDKSFGGKSGYRESCGEEYYKGVSITVAHYPRGTSNSELAELIGQQHNLCNYARANAFLIDRILKMRPAMTFSIVGSPYSDIWVPEIVDQVVPINIYDNGKEFIKVLFQNQAFYIPINGRRRDAVTNCMQFEYSGNRKWYEIHLRTAMLPSDCNSLLFYTIHRIEEQGAIKLSKADPGWSVLWDFKELKDFLVSHKCEKGKPPIGYWSWDDVRGYSQQCKAARAQNPGKMTSIAKLVEQSGFAYMNEYETIRMHDPSIRNPQDVEPYSLHTVVQQIVKEEKNATRLFRANQLAYLIKLSEMARRPKGDENSIISEDLLTDFEFREDNIILEGNRRIWSLCNPSEPKYKVKKVAPNSDYFDQK